MHLGDHFARADRPTLSFEFFPAKTVEANQKLHEAIETLAARGPAFISLTYGAGGSTRDATQDLVRHVKTTTTVDPVPHFTCVNHGEEEINSTLKTYAALGIQNILALRGDAPRDCPGHDHQLDFCPYAVDLVGHIRQFNERGFHPDDRGFAIGVAGFPEGHPGTPNRFQELDHLKAKVDAGADYICTQLFFENHDFHDFVERCDLAGIRVPILAGLLPITSLASMRRMAELAGGARVPGRLLRSLLKVENDPEAVHEIGIQHAAEQTRDLLATGVAGIHYYTLNQAGPTLEILDQAGWREEVAPLKVPHAVAKQVPA